MTDYRIWLTETLSLRTSRADSIRRAKQAGKRIEPVSADQLQDAQVAKNDNADGHQGDSQ